MKAPPAAAAAGLCLPSLRPPPPLPPYNPKLTRPPRADPTALYPQQYAPATLAEAKTLAAQTAVGVRLAVEATTCEGVSVSLADRVLRPCDVAAFVAGVGAPPPPVASSFFVDASLGDTLTSFSGSYDDAQAAAFNGQNTARNAAAAPAATAAVLVAAAAAAVLLVAA